MGIRTISQVYTFQRSIRLYLLGGVHGSLSGGRQDHVRSKYGQLLLIYCVFYLYYYTMEQEGNVCNILNNNMGTGVIGGGGITIDIL